MGILFSPGETYQDINRKPTWLAPLIIAMVTSSLFTIFFTWRVNPDWDRFTRDQIKKAVDRRGGQMPSEEQIQQQVAFTKGFAKFSPVVYMLIPPIIYLFLAGLFTLAMILIAAQTTFKKILSVVAWSSAATGLVYTLVFMAALMVKDQESLNNLDLADPTGTIPTNLGVMMTSPGPLRTLVSSFDIFTIWQAILLTMGFAAIAGSRKITTAKTRMVVFGLWAVWILVKVGWAAAF
jgi:hypothetical protein